MRSLTVTLTLGKHPAHSTFKDMNRFQKVGGRHWDMCCRRHTNGVRGWERSSPLFSQLRIPAYQLRIYFSYAACICLPNRSRLKHLRTSHTTPSHTPHSLPLSFMRQVNHFPGSWCIGRKDRLARTIQKFRRTHNAAFNIHPGES